MNGNRNFISTLQRNIVILLGIAILLVYRFFKNSIFILS